MQPLKRRQCHREASSFAISCFNWDRGFKFLEGDVFATLWPSTHVIMGLHVSKSIRGMLQTHAKRIEIGKFVSRRWAQETFRWNSKSECIDEFDSQHYAFALSQFRNLGVQVEITGRLFLSEVYRVIISARDAGWQGQIVECDVSNLCFVWHHAVQDDVNEMVIQMLQACTGLQKANFDLQHKRYGLPLHCLTQGIASCCSLTHVELRSVRLRNLTPVEVNQIASCFRKFPNLQRLKLSGFVVDDSTAAALARAIESCPELTSLNLGGNKINASRLHPCLVATRFCRRLERLGLYGHNIDDACCQQLAVNIAQHWPTFRSLNLTGNRLSLGRARTLCGALCHAHALQRLDLRDTKVQGLAVDALAKTLAHTPALVHLDLAKNGIGSAGEAPALFRALAACPRLAHLDLSFNQIGTVGAQALALALPHLPALRYLNLFHNALFDAGAGALAGVLGPCRSLRYLDLRQNGISSLGATLLGNLVAHAPALATLDLSKNVRPAGAKCRFRPNRPWSQARGGATSGRAGATAAGGKWLDDGGVARLVGMFPRCGCEDEASRRGVLRPRLACWRVVWSTPERWDVVHMWTCQGRWVLGCSQWNAVRGAFIDTPYV